jgi:hypothetical protein
LEAMRGISDDVLDEVREISKIENLI